MADHLYALPSGYRLEAYEIKRVLSVDNYGIKYIAVDHEPREHRQVAIKEYLPERLAVRREDTQVLPKSNADKGTFDFGLDRFLAEARLQARLHEEHLVRIHAVLRANGTGYVVMDYVEGETLAQSLARRGTLPEEQLHTIVRPLLAPLELIHGMGFVHQDIRPGTIVLRADGSPVLLDLGAGQQTLGGARQAFGNRKRSFALSTATDGFSALEQYSTAGRLGPWTDIYALGAVMYHCLTGRPPPDAPSRAIEDELVPVARATKQPCAESTAAAIDAALAISAGQRPPSIEAWRTKLPYGTADAEPQRPGHMARGATRVSARGFGPARSSKPSAESQPRRVSAWVLPAAALLVLSGMLTYVDIGVLRACEGEECNIAPVEAPAPRLPASLTIRTTPPDAEVKIGDRVVGHTPLELTDLAPGEYSLTLSHPLYKDLALEETLTSGGSTVVERTLTPGTGELAVTSQPVGAWIEIDGERVGATPATLADLPIGPLVVILGAEGYRSEQMAIAIRKDATAEIDVSLEASIAYGTLTLTLDPPDAVVALPDAVGPYSPGMQLAEGPYSVTISREGYTPLTRVVEVAGNQRLAISLDVDPQPFLVTTVPADATIRFLSGSETYSSEVRLPPGEYRLQAVLLGYRTWEDTIAHGTTPTRREVVLEPGIAEFADRLRNGEPGPTMVLVESGQFRMGCLASAGCRDNEVPAHAVDLAAPFALSKFEVTFADYDRFTAATERPLASSPRGWQRGNWPVVNVSWRDASAYAQWLTAETGRSYRLPSEAEWEYAARAGSETAYSWGDALGSALANCNGCGSEWDNVSPAAVGSFTANAWGLHDMHGNVWEWVQDCQWPDYRNASGDSAAREDGDCLSRVLRGGSYSNSPTLIRSSVREWDSVSIRVTDVGFRVAAVAE